VDGLRSTLGGTGLAISLKCQHRELAVEYARYVASATCQRTLYTEVGGQPGHRAAWLDAGTNQLTNHYFRDTLPALDRAYVRPRYDGYLHFQDAAGPVVRQALQGQLKADEACRQLRNLYDKTRS
jgi:multiple sugar transport system substrate-binding protein